MYEFAIEQIKRVSNRYNNIFYSFRIISLSTVGMILLLVVCPHAVTGDGELTVLRAC